MSLSKYFTSRVTEHNFGVGLMERGGVGELSRKIAIYK